MPRGPRLDAPGTLHHVIARGIERKEIFKKETEIMGRVKREWQNTNEILGLFGKHRKKAIRNYKDFIKDGAGQGK
ncbi:MAG: hypothetical protein AB1498_10385, partial [bacterium]